MHNRNQPVSQPTSVAATVNMLDSKLRLLAQRIKVIENNLQVVARTLVSHNKQIKALESKSTGASVNVDEIITQVMAKMPKTQGGTDAAAAQEIALMREEISKLKAKIDAVEYKVNALNPVEVVTLDQLKTAIDSRIEELKREGKLG